MEEQNYNNYGRDQNVFTWFNKIKISIVLFSRGGRKSKLNLAEEEYKKRVEEYICSSCYKHGKLLIDSASEDDLSELRKTVNWTYGVEISEETAKKIIERTKNNFEASIKSLEKVKSLIVSSNQNEIRFKLKNVFGIQSKYFDFYLSQIYIDCGMKSFHDGNCEEAIDHFRKIVFRRKKCLLIQAYTGLADAQIASGRNLEALMTVIYSKFLFWRFFFLKKLFQQYTLERYEKEIDSRFNARMTLAYRRLLNKE